jgi:hypothetical protein
VGRHEPEHNACGQRQQTEAQEGSEQISAQLSKFNADSRTRNSFLKQKSTFSSNCAKNRIFIKMRKLTYI